MKVEKKKLRVLISRTDRIGDVVLTLPLAGYLKTHFPDIEVGFLCRSYTAPVVKACRYVDQVLIWEPGTVWEWRRGLQLFQTYCYDVILHVFPSFSIALTAWLNGIPERIGTSRRWFHWLFCNRKVSFSRRHSDLHEAQLNFFLLKPLGVDSIPSLTEIPCYFGIEAIDSLPIWVKELLDEKRFKLILHPGSGGSAPEWGISNFQALIRLLPRKRFQVFVTGSGEEAKRFQDEFPFDGEHLINLAGKLSLGEFITFIDHCDGLVAGSTGPLHLAAALGKVAIGLFVPRKPVHPGRWGPLGHFAYALVHDPNCRRCMRGQPCSCIQQIRAERVAGLLQNVLPKYKRGEL